MPLVITTPLDFVDPDPYYTHITTVGPTPTYYWPLRETSGSVADEVVDGAAKMDGVYSNVTFNQPSLNSATTKAVEFNGANSNVNSLGDAPTYDEFNFIHQTAVFTISCWIKKDPLTGEECIMGNTATTSEHGFFFVYDNVNPGRTNALKCFVLRGAG